MDYDKLSEGYYQQRKQNSLDEHLKNQKAVQKFPDGFTNHGSSTPVEVDYAIVNLEGTYLVARSRHLGSLDYEVICNCTSHHEARAIVEALSK